MFVDKIPVLKLISMFNIIQKLITKGKGIKIGKTI